MSVERLGLKDLRYELSESQIAPFPLENRDESRLLVYRSQSNTISHRRFFEIPELIPPNALLVFNTTQVIRARIPAQKSSGGMAEVFLLNPVAPSRDPSLALSATLETSWNCLIGGKKIGVGDKLTAGTCEIEVMSKEGSDALVRIRFESGTFADCLESFGKIPLPPYIKREAENSDLSRYQTVYSKELGSVAAPTAGLHFTEAVLEKIRARGIETASLTLHVGGGTFRPVKTESLEDHPMHAEQFFVSPKALSQVARALKESRPIVAVGTTSLRTLESLYWIGARGLKSGERLGQWDWKSATENASAAQVFESLERANPSGLTGETEIMILPPYPFKVVSALITNFHQPESTLLALVAAFVGHPRWQEIYREALSQGYRFLSYGDSSILFRDQS